jgi:NAD(P)-dependent dehydrogenase (short-subunit alcohol dehydrogenase family)
MTEDGYEMTWQVNYLSNLVLALLLLRSMDKEKGRILIVGSWSHEYTLKSFFTRFC